jgi:Ser/Thr protein kinase RdoA (MazF antagonist)
VSPLAWERLTSRGRARRLRRVAVTALERYPFDVARLRLIASDANMIYRVNATDGERYLLRISSPRSCHTVEGTRAETDWLGALSRDTDLPIAAPVADRDGEYVREIGADGVPEARTVAVFRWVDGPDLDDRMSPATAARFGTLSARLHEHARTWRPSAPLRIRRFDRVFPYSQPGFPLEPVVLFEDPYRDLVPRERRRVFERAIEIVQRTIDDGLAENGPDIVVHGDLHPWNVKVRRDGRLVPLDFEDLMWGRPILDVATTLYYVELNDDGPELSRAFRSGYEEVAPWPERDPGTIRTLRAGRGLLLLNWVLAANEPEKRGFATKYVQTIETRLRDWLGL